MKARKIVVFVLLLVFFGLLMVVGSISYNSGVSYGEANAEKIRKSKIITVDSVVVENFVTAAYTLNEKSPINVKSSGRIVPGKMIGISSEVQGVLESSITLKKGTKFKKGDIVIVDVLKGAAHYNGTKGKILYYVPDLGRYETLMDYDNKKVKLKEENLKLESELKPKA